MDVEDLSADLSRSIGAAGHSDQNEVFSAVALYCGEERLGTLPNLVLRPHADGSGTRLHVDAALTGIFAWNIFNQSNPLRAQGAQFESEQSVELELDPSFSVLDVDWFRPDRVCPGYSLKDAWFSSETELNFRFERVKGKNATDVVETHFYQALRHSSVNFRKILSVKPTEEAMVAAALLANPLQPILIINVKDGGITEVQLIPFPALCRGGLHTAEQLILSETGDYMSDLAESFNVLASKLIDRKIGKARPVSISSKLTNVTGAERLLTRSFIEWLTDTMGARLRLEPGDDGSSAWPEEFLAADGTDLFAVDAETRFDAPGMEIPIDSIPTISLLVEDSNGQDIARQFSCPQFLVADANSYRGLWQVRLPVAHLEVVRRASIGLAYPILKRSSPHEDMSRSEEDLGLPSIIRFPSIGTPDDLRLLYSPLRMEHGRDAPPRQLQCIVVDASGNPNLAMTLSTLENQTGVDLSIEVVSSSASSNARKFKGPRIDHSVATQINKMAALSPAKDLLFVSSGVIAHDPRTLATMAAILDEDCVGTVGCITVGEAPGGRMKVQSAGLFVDSASFYEPGVVYLHEPSGEFPLWGATYPVVASRFNFILVKASVWNRIGGLSVTLPSRASIDLNFGLAVRNIGYANMCTSVVSIAAPSSAVSQQRRHAPGIRTAAAVQSALTSTTLVRRL